MSLTSVWFEFVTLQTDFLSHYHAYALRLPPTSQRTNFVIKHRDLPCFRPFGLYCCSNINNNSLLRYAVIRSSITL